jgi:putative transposase
MIKNSLVKGEFYHVFTKSIADYIIFNNDVEFARMVKVIHYYQKENPPQKFSYFVKMQNKGLKSFQDKAQPANSNLIEIIAYCLMPTHLHLILTPVKEDGLSIFMSNILNSYTRYFNIKHKRKGPLWEGRFKSVLVESDEQLLHLTRYIHLNPVTACIVNKPQEWMASSYLEYLSQVNENDKICHYDNVLDINPSYYKNFVEDRISYQRELAYIKSVAIESNPNSTS